MTGDLRPKMVPPIVRAIRYKGDCRYAKSRIKADEKRYLRKAVRIVQRQRLCEEMEAYGNR